MSARESQASNDIMSPTGFADFYRAHLATVFGYLSRLTNGTVAWPRTSPQDTFVALTRQLRKGRTECADIRWMTMVRAPPLHRPRAP